MAPITTVEDYQRENRVVVPEELTDHVLNALQSAEDDLERAVGSIFYNQDPEGRAGRDWLRLASYRALEYITATDEAFRSALTSPFQSETIGRYSYTLKAPAAGVMANPAYKAILDFYKGLATAEIQYNRGGRFRPGDEYSRW